MFYKAIELDKARNFKYGMKAISLIEESIGKAITKIDLNNLTMRETAIVIWGGLVHEDKELTPDKVMDLIDEYSDVTTVLLAAGEALQGAFGGKGEKNLKKVASK